MSDLGWIAALRVGDEVSVNGRLLHVEEAEPKKAPRRLKVAGQWFNVATGLGRHRGWYPRDCCGQRTERTRDRLFPAAEARRLAHLARLRDRLVSVQPNTLSSETLARLCAVLDEVGQ